MGAKSNQSGSTMVWVGVIGVALIVGTILLFQYNNQEDEDLSFVPAESVESVEEATQDEAQEVEVTQETASLEAVSPYTGSGTATRATENGTFTHTVTANIGDPADGKFFEGWLVGPSIESTGMLFKQGDVYVLSFNSTEDFSAHNQIVITEETEANGLDGVPEAHVLEGNF